MKPEAAGKLASVLTALSLALSGVPGLAADSATDATPGKDSATLSTPAGAEPAQAPAGNAVPASNTAPAAATTDSSSPALQGSEQPAAAGSSQAATGQTSSSPAASEPTPTPAPAKAAAPVHAAQPAPAVQPAKPAQPAKPVMLYGRIEQICEQARPQLNLKLQAMTPMRDTSLDSKTQKPLSASVSQQTYPMDYRGTWGGTVSVWTSYFDPLCWQFDAEETKKEAALMKPGVKGDISLNFYQTANNRVALQPTQVVFTAMMSGQEAAAKMQQELGPMASMMNSQMLGNMKVPMMYALFLGSLTEGRGVTGNSLKGQVVKNSLRELKPGVLEHQVVNRLVDTNPTTGKVQNSYGENVIRITKISNNELYLQIAEVNYRNDGKFLNKIVLYGTVTRGGGGSTIYPGMQAMPGLQGAPGMQGMPGGAGDVGAAMQQLQKLFQQMQPQ